MEYTLNKASPKLLILMIDLENQITLVTSKIHTLQQEVDTCKDLTAILESELSELRSKLDCLTNIKRLVDSYIPEPSEES